MLDETIKHLNILHELLFTGMHFIILWPLFYKLYYQESKVKRILLIVSMALFHPLFVTLFGPYFSIPLVIRIFFPEAGYVILVLLAGGKKRNVVVMTVYHLGVSIFIEYIAAFFYLGITGNYLSIAANFLFFTNDVIFIMGITVFFASFLWSVFYYFTMRKVSEEAMSRIPLRVWLIVLLIPFIGIICSHAATVPFLKQLESGVNNFLILGFFSIALLIITLSVFYLYIKFVLSSSASLLAGELNKTPPLYTRENGLSPQFIEKYGLSNRQVEITEALLKGKSNKEIACLFDIEVNTVQVHLQNIYRKTGSPSRYALMALVGLGN